MPDEKGGVLIAGCGYVGTALAELCLQDGRKVFAVRRTPIGLPRAVTALRFDLLEPSDFPELPESIAAVVYAVSADHHTDQAYRDAYVHGLRNLLLAVQGSGARPRLIFVSSTGVYAQEQGEWVDEESPAVPVHFSGKRLLEGEEIVNRYSGPGVVLRLSGIYGPGRSPILDQLRNGTARYSRLPVYTNRVHRDDCAGMLHHLITMEEPDSLYIGTDDLPATKNEIVGWLAGRIGAQLRDDAFEGETTERKSKRCRNVKLRQTGYELRYPTYREGFEAILAAEKA